MIGFIVDQIIGPFWPYILGVLGVLGAFVTGRVGGAAKVKRKQAEAGLKKTVEGAEAARKGRAEASADLADGKTPEEIRRKNDGAW